MKVAPFESRLDLPAELLPLVTGVDRAHQLSAGAALQHYVAAVAESLELYGVILLKIGALRLDRERSYALARLILAQLREEVVHRGAPRGLRVECDEPDPTLVAPDQTTRNRLPHTDGQSSTYLTPSRLDVPSFDPRLRMFSPTGGHTSRYHKPYAGIFIQEPGDALSVTTFYDLFQLLYDAYVHQRGDGRPSVAELATWMAANIAAADERRRAYGFHYITLAGMLGGAVDPACEVVEYGAAEQPIPPQLLARFPALDRLRVSCPCGHCAGETERVFCAMVRGVLGSNWSGVRERVETWVSSERFDLILWNNLALLHGAVMGSGSRTLSAVYLSMNEPTGEEYETWLSRLWHSRLTRVLPYVVARRVV